MTQVTLSLKYSDAVMTASALEREAVESTHRAENCEHIGSHTQAARHREFGNECSRIALAFRLAISKETTK